MLPSKFETIFVVGSVKDLKEFNLHWFVTQVLTKLYYFFNQPTHLIRAASLQILSKHLTSRVAGKTTSSLPSGFSSIILLSVAKLGIHKMVVVFVHKHSFSNHHCQVLIELRDFAFTFTFFACFPVKYICR